MLGTKSKALFKSRQFRLLATTGIVVAPVAIVIACGQLDVTSNSSLKDIGQLRTDALSAVKLTGDSRNFNYDIPSSLTKVDANNQVSAQGTIEALTVHGRTTLKLGSATDDSLNNNEFMPMPLLKAYLRGNVFVNAENRIFYRGDDQQEKDLLGTLGNNYGFTAQNAIAPTLFGEWSKNSFEVSYRPLSGFKLPSAEEGNNVSPNVSELVTYVNLDPSALTTPSAQNERFRDAFRLNPTTPIQNNAYNFIRPLTMLDLPTGWNRYISSFELANGEAAATNLTWSVTLPNLYQIPAAERSMLIRFTPLRDYVLSRQVFSFNPLLASALPEIVDNLPAYQALNLAQLNLTAVQGELRADEAALNLPANTKIEYRLNSTDGWLSLAGLTQALSAKSTYDFSDLEVHLASVDSARFLVINDKLTKPNVSALLGFVNTQSFFDSASTLRVNVDNSTDTTISWQNVPTTPAELSASVSGLEFLVGEYPTLTSASSAANWQSTTPSTTLNLAWRRANLWMRVKVRDGYVVNRVIKDLTASSTLESLLTRVDNSALATQVSNRVKVASGRHNAITWASDAAVPVPANLASSVRRIEYLSGNYPTAEAAANTLSELWSQSLPTKLDYDHDKRFLWARFVPTDTTRLTVYLVNLTTNSGIKNVLSLVDERFSGSSTLDTLSKVSLRGTPSAVTIDESGATVPNGALITYTLDGKTYNSAAALKTYLEVNPDVVKTLPLYALKAHFVSSDASRFVVDNNQEQNVNISQFEQRELVALDELDTLLSALALDVESSTRRALVWTNTVAIPPSLASKVKSIEYLSTNIQGLQLALRTQDWVTTLPTSLSIAPELQYFYARVVPVEGYRFTSVDAVKGYNLTQSSKIREVVSVLTAAQVNAATTAISNTVKIKDGSTHDAVEWEAPATLPAELGGELIVEYLSGNYPTQASAEAVNISEWKASLPTSISYESSQRFLWARVKLLSAQALPAGASRYVNLSDKLASVITKVDLSTNFNLVSLTRIAYTSRTATTSAAINVNLDQPIPAGTRLAYRFGEDGTWGDADALIAATATTRPTSALLADHLYVRLESTDSTKYMVVDQKQARLVYRSVQTIRDVAPLYNALNRANAEAANNVQIFWSSDANQNYAMLIAWPTALRKAALDAVGLVTQYSFTDFENNYLNINTASPALAASNGYGFPAQEANTYTLFTFPAANSTLKIRVIANRDIDNVLTSVLNVNDYAAITNDINVGTNRINLNSQPLSVLYAEPRKWQLENIAGGVSVNLNNTRARELTTYRFHLAYNNYNDGSVYAIIGAIRNSYTDTAGLPPKESPYDPTTNNYGGLAYVNDYLFTIHYQTGALYRFDPVRRVWETRGMTNLKSLLVDLGASAEELASTTFETLEAKKDGTGFYAVTNTGRLAEYTFSGTAAPGRWRLLSQDTIDEALGITYANVAYTSRWRSIVDAGTKLYLVNQYYGSIVVYDKQTAAFTYVTGEKTSSTQENGEVTSSTPRFTSAALYRNYLLILDAQERRLVVFNLDTNLFDEEGFIANERALPRALDTVRASDLLVVGGTFYVLDSDATIRRFIAP